MAAVLLTAAPAAALTDVPDGHWAKAAITGVAVDHDWMRDYGDAFHPEELLTRRHLAAALVRTFAPGQEPDGQTSFSDLPAEDPSFRFAAVAVRKGWMSAPAGAFSPDATVAAMDMDLALARALGLGPELQGLGAIRTADGAALKKPKGFESLVLAHVLGLHVNHPGSRETLELAPTTQVRRADMAYALSKAQRAAGTYRVTSLQRYRDIVLPIMTSEQRKTVEFALAYTGTPYVYAGEWPSPTPDGYCCGEQKAGGLDCSGFVWWVMRAPDELWDNTDVRPYRGWPLPQRSSKDMARPRPRVKFTKARPMDLLFFDADRSHRGWRGVDHVGLALGNGWMIHSSGGRDGVTIDWVGDGWWRDHAKWARRLIR